MPMALPLGELSKSQLLPLLLPLLALLPLLLPALLLLLLKPLLPLLLPLRTVSEQAPLVSEQAPPLPPPPLLLPPLPVWFPHRNRCAGLVRVRVRAARGKVWRRGVTHTHPRSLPRAGGDDLLEALWLWSFEATYQVLQSSLAER